MEDLAINSKIIKRIDIYENKEEYPPLKEDRKNFIQNKMLKFYKIIKNKENPYRQTLFMSDNKGALYIIEFDKDNKSNKIMNFDYICNDSKYILVDIIKLTKYGFYISLSLNPCFNVFKLIDNPKTGLKEIETIQHINLKDNKNKNKYNKVIEFNKKNKDYLLLFGDEKIELWYNNNYNNHDIINYEKVYTLLYNINQNLIDNDNIISNKISNIYKIDDEKLVIFIKDKLEFDYLKISEINNNNSTIIDIINKINIKGIQAQFENINSLFIEKDYIFLGLCDSLVLVSVPYGEIIQTYKIGKVIQVKKINENNDTMVFVEINENEFYFIKYKFENSGLKEDYRIKYDKWIYKFDIIQNGEIIAIYDIKGIITLLKI